MQVIEVSMIGVRSAVLRLTRAGSPLRFEIYPMVHMAEPDFYQAVAERLRLCDLIVAEGVGGPDRTSKRPAGITAITSSYRLPARFRRDGLVEQEISYRALGVPVVRPDMTGEQFTEGWRAVPWQQRAFALVGAPLAGLERLAFGSRRAMSRHLELDDTDFHDKFSDIESMAELMALIGDQRDQLLIAELDRIHRERAHEPITVAVVYGALHVPPVVYAMRALHRYAPRGAEWLTVIKA
ncbi:hypothetical protein [Actinoplanes solisilvae]|uniref:hypothetical protein n=1 Tax=Actinoplanes solisilvae TaxID=2486853 RepID=UPI000FD6FB07|nr:hypothetical protein [Actinoplanes solisilvae]